jgi:ribosome recycling factor
MRREANDDAKKQEKNSEISEDDLKEMLSDIQDTVDKAVKEIDEIIAAKDKEILEV